MKVLPLLIAAALLLAAADLALVEPAEMANGLSAKPLIVYVGPSVLYRSKHIPTAIYGGFASRPDGLESLKTSLAKVPHDREIVIYCGCCPWNVCPNIKPAFALLQQMGFTKVKALHLPYSFKADWIDKGYPVEAGAPSAQEAPEKRPR